MHKIRTKQTFPQKDGKRKLLCYFQMLHEHVEMQEVEIKKYLEK